MLNLARGLCYFSTHKSVLIKKARVQNLKWKESVKNFYSFCSLVYYFISYVFLTLIKITMYKCIIYQIMHNCQKPLLAKRELFLCTLILIQFFSFSSVIIYNWTTRCKMWWLYQLDFSIIINPVIFTHINV